MNALSRRSKKSLLLLAGICLLGGLTYVGTSIQAQDNAAEESGEAVGEASVGAPAGGPPADGMGSGGPPPMPPTPVMTALARAGAFETTFRITGTVESISDSALAAEAEGVVERVFAEEGDFVKAGAPLMQLRLKPLQLAYEQLNGIANSDEQILTELRNGTREEDLRIAETDYEGSKIGFEVAESEFNRFKKLLDQGSVSVSEFDSVRNSYESARSRYNSAKATFDRAKTGPRAEELAAAEARAEASRAAANLAKDTLERATLRAPFDGTITRRHISEGSWIKVGDPAFHFESVDTIRVRARVPENQFSLAEIGREMELSFDAIPGEKRTGTVSRRIFKAEGNSRSFPILIDVDNTDRKLAPGMLARMVLASAGNGERSVVVPKDAITPSPMGAVIYRVKRNPEGPPTADLLEIRTGRFFGEAVEVFGDVKAGDEIIIRGNERIFFPGQPLALNTFITNPLDVAIDPADFFNESNRPAR